MRAGRADQRSERRRGLGYPRRARAEKWECRARTLNGTVLSQPVGVGLWAGVDERAGRDAGMARCPCGASAFRRNGLGAYELEESALATKVLQDYIGEFKDLLLEQLALYAGASIYVDCANREGVALLRELYADVRAFGTDADPWIYYSEKGQFIVVNTYHPSYVGLGQAHYDNMREAVADFFKAHPHFGK